MEVNLPKLSSNSTKKTYQSRICSFKCENSLIRQTSQTSLCSTTLAAKRHLRADPWLRSDVLRDLEISLFEQGVNLQLIAIRENDDFMMTSSPNGWCHLQSWVKFDDFDKPISMDFWPDWPEAPWSQRSWWPRACTAPGWRRARTSWEESRASVPVWRAVQGMVLGRFQLQSSQVFPRCFWWFSMVVNCFATFFIVVHCCSALFWNGRNQRWVGCHSWTNIDLGCATVPGNPCWWQN